MNLIDISLKINNYPISKATKRLEEIHNLQKNNFSAYVEHQKRKILNYHLNNNTFYKNFNLPKNVEWENLPVLDKQSLQIPLKDRLSNSFNLNNIFKNKTSGSTGNPFYFAKDKFCHALTWAVIENRFNWHNLHGKKQARFYGLPKDKLSRNKELLKDKMSNRVRFNVFDLSENSLKKWILKFKKTNFSYLNGYTTVLTVFAKFLVQKDIVLKNICPTLKACVVTSEMLFHKDRKLMEKAFGVKVLNEYGASELDLIAFEDVNNNWILNTETLYVEILDDENNILDDGEVGNIVITSLYNKAHPFIRYKIGDKGAIRKINSSQYKLEKLEGRSEDIVKLPSGKQAPGLTFYYITKSIMEDSATIKEIKVEQNFLDSFTIKYVSNSKLTHLQKRGIINALEDYLEPNLKINFVKLDFLERNKSGKLKQFTSLING